MASVKRQPVDCGVIENWGGDKSLHGFKVVMKAGLVNGSRPCSNLPSK